jgi:hypothetical protein
LTLNEGLISLGDDEDFLMAAKDREFYARINDIEAESPIIECYFVNK